MNINNQFDLLKKDFLDVEKEVAIFSDPLIKVGTLMQPSWQLGNLWKKMWSQEPGNYQICRMYSGQYLTGVYTFQVTQHLNTHLNDIISKTTNLFIALSSFLKEVDSAPLNEKVDQQRPEIVNIASRLFRQFSCMREKLYYLRQTFQIQLDQNLSDGYDTVRSQYVQLYQTNLEKAQKSYVELIEMYLNFIAKGEVKTTLQPLIEQSINHNDSPFNPTEVSLNHFNQAFTEFTDRPKKMNEQLNQNLKFFELVSTHLPEESEKIYTNLDFEGCRTLANYSKDLYTLYCEKLVSWAEKYTQKTTLDNLSELTMALELVAHSLETTRFFSFLVTEGASHTVEKSNLNNQYIAEIIQKLKAKTDISSLTIIGGWQDNVFQEICGRSTMPFGEAIKALKKMNAPAELLIRFSKIQAILKLVGGTAQLFSAQSNK